MKKGAGASPLFVIDAPKPVTESRIGSGHPGKPIFYVTEQRANRMPGNAFLLGPVEFTQNTKVNFKYDLPACSVRTETYKIPQNLVAILQSLGVPCHHSLSWALTEMMDRSLSTH